MLCQEFNDTNLPEGEELDTLIDNLNNEINRIMDTLAPHKKVTLLTHKRQPWYDDQIKSNIKSSETEREYGENTYWNQIGRPIPKSKTFITGFLSLRKGNSY